MAKNKITISFENIHQLWSFAQNIKAVNIEIITTQKILICNCSEEDLSLLPKYNGRIVEEFQPMSQ